MKYRSPLRERHNFIISNAGGKTPLATIVLKLL